MSSPPPTNAADTVLARLRDDREEGPLAALCALTIDHLLGRRLADVVDTESLQRGALAALAGPALEAAVERHLGPSLRRAIARAQARDERVGAWLPESAVQELEKLLREPVVLDPDEVRRGVQGDAIGKMITTLVQEALSRFVRTGEGGGGVGAGLFGLMGKGAGLLRDAGKGLLGGLGDEIERQVQRRMQERLVEWILSDDTARSLGHARARFFRSLMRRRIGEAAELPIDRLLALVPELVRHNLARPEVQQAITDELQAVLQVEGQRELRELLAEAGLLEQVRADLVRQARKEARSLVESDAFAGWLTALLA